jgi:hypothetical protein
MNNVPYGFCQCGCGRRTKISDRTNARHGWQKGEPLRYLKGHSGYHPWPASFWERTKKCTDTGCWEWQGSMFKDGYGSVPINGHNQHVHRVAYELAYGSIPQGKLILHRCNNRRCCNPDHLYAGTQKENVRDCVESGRRHIAYGTLDANAKLTDDQVREIRQLYKPRKVTQDYLAARYGVSRSAIGYILRGQHWKHLL